MDKPTEPCNYTIAQQWSFFLERAGFKPGELPKIQEDEMQKAFYAACGQMLFLFRDEITNLDPVESIKAATAMVNEINIFWKTKMQEYESEQQSKGTKTPPTT